MSKPRAARSVATRSIDIPNLNFLSAAHRSSYRILPCNTTEIKFTSLKQRFNISACSAPSANIMPYLI